MKSSDKKFNLVKSSFNIIEKSGWKSFSLQKLSYAEKIPINEIKIFFKSEITILDEFSKMIDIKVEKSFDYEELTNTSVKDNLFELIMLRLEYMQPYRNALKSIKSSFKSDPLVAKSVAKNVMNSLDFYLELTNAFNDSFLDIFKKKSIFLIYSYIFMIWLEDDSDELSKTMSELDKLLTFSEKIALDFKTYTPF
ncbi:MAG: hypothetical protein CM15mP40_08920 [Alphaproteobacteria bacterium]|nr:MAG: hypothetical protein CM15mP40_08920 [Alphaproteobacteria bacterium]